MKRLLAICLCLMMLPVAALADTAYERETRLWAWVDELMEQHTGYTSNAYRHGQIIGDPDNGWNFSIVLLDHPADEDGIICYSITPEGVLMYERGPEKISLGQQAVNAIYACGGDDCYLEIAQVIQDWKPRLDELRASDPSTARFMELDIRFPEEGVITYEEASAAVRSVLLSQPGWSEETLTHFYLDFCAYMQTWDLDRPVWLFYYNIYVPSIDEVKDYDELRRLRNEAYDYTINGEKTPVHFCVLVDAADGSLVEDPRFDYVPIQHSFWDYIERPVVFFHTDDGGNG